MHICRLLYRERYMVSLSSIKARPIKILDFFNFIYFYKIGPNDVPVIKWLSFYPWGVKCSNVVVM